MTAMQRGALDEAERLLDVALEDSETDADLFNTIATVAYRKGDYAKAIEWVDRALGVRKGDARLWFNRGLTCAAGGRSSDARTSFQRVLELQPKHDGALQWLGCLEA